MRLLDAESAFIVRQQRELRGREIDLPFHI